MNYIVCANGFVSVFYEEYIEVEADSPIEAKEKARDIFAEHCYDNDMSCDTIHTEIII